MSTASMRSADFSELDDNASGRQKAVRWLLILLALALVAFLVAWLLGYIRLMTDPRVVEIQKLQADTQKQFMANGGPQTLDEAKAAVAAMGQIREKIESLPENLRREAGRRGGNVFRNTMQTRINAYFSLPSDQRQAELDRQIHQEELFRKAWEASRSDGGRPGGPPRGMAANGGPGGGGGGGGGGPGGAGGGPGGAGGGAGGGGPGGPGGGGPPRGGSEEDRNRWRKNMIDSTTPEQRARYVEYRRAMDARREQRGLPQGFGR
jgi:predicted Holliday junction resolvase-like endonuclease